jgi:hypothetical protein
MTHYSPARSKGRFRALISVNQPDVPRLRRYSLKAA